MLMRAKKSVGNEGSLVYPCSITAEAETLRLEMHPGGRTVRLLGKFKAEWDMSSDEEGKAIRCTDKVKKEFEAAKKRIEDRGVKAKRGEVKGFSPKSRWRMMLRMGEIDFQKAGLPTFVTLTYPGEWGSDWKEWKEHLHRWITDCLQERWPGAWGVWRIEFQQRGAPHYHLLVWDGPQIEAIEAVRPNGKMAMVPLPGSAANQEIWAWVGETWYRKVGSGDERHLQAGTRTEPIAQIEGVFAYCSKYIAKASEGHEPECFGRVWGVFGRKYWKSNKQETELDRAEWLYVRRVMRRYLEHKTGHRYLNRARLQNMSALVNPAIMDKLKRWIDENRGGCPF